MRVTDLVRQHPGFMAKVSHLRSLFERHVREEEQEFLPVVDARLPVDVSERLGEQMKELFDTLVVRSRRSLKVA